MRISDWSSDVCSSDLNVVDDAEQVVATLRDGIEAPLLPSIERRVAEQFRSTEDGVERCTDLVTHVGEEITLGLCRRFDIALRAFPQPGPPTPARGTARDSIETTAGHKTGGNAGRGGRGGRG